MFRPLPASVSVVRTGKEFTASVLHLTPVSLFLPSDADLRFRDGVTVRFAGLTVEGLVAFVPEAPRGAVVLFRARAEDRALIRSLAAGFASDAASLPDTPRSDAVHTSPDTDLAVRDAPETRPDVHRGPFEDAEDATEPPMQRAPEIEPLQIDDTTVPSTEAGASSSSGRFGLERLVRDIMDGADPIRGSNGTDRSALEGEPEITLLDPSALLAEPSQSSSAFPKPTAESIECDDKTNDETTARGGPSRAPTLPVLDSDGTTLRFESRAQYRAQLEAAIVHGSIVAISPPLPIGAARSLAIEIPGCERYVIGARVLFHDGEKTGFRIDAFGEHRTRLLALATPL